MLRARSLARSRAGIREGFANAVAFAFAVVGLVASGGCAGQESVETAKSRIAELHRSAHVAGSGIEWNGDDAGDAAVGVELLELRERLVRSDSDDRDAAIALEMATRLGRRLVERSRREDVGRSWSDPRTTGIVIGFLQHLFEVTHDERFDRASRDGLDFLFERPLGP
jgi:hypothetical protein